MDRIIANVRLVNGPGKSMKQQLNVIAFSVAEDTQGDGKKIGKDYVRLRGGSLVDAPRPQSFSQLIDVKSGDEVIGDDSPTQRMWLVRSGILRLQRYSFDGRRQILSLFLPGDIVGYDRPWREGLRVETATACSLFRLDRRDFEAQLTEYPDGQRDFYLRQHEQIARLRWLTWSIGVLRPEERISAFLALATRFMPFQRLPDGTGLLEMVLGRPDIADLLATTLETISRVTHSLNQAGVIDIRNPSHFRIVDLRKLRELGQIGAAFDMSPFDRRGANALSLVSARSRINIA
jgi:CRP-like cAMP-binding protein